MLQATRPNTPYELADAQPLDFLEFFAAVIRQQYLAIAAATLLAITAAAFYVYVTPPTYASRATIIIDPGKTQAQLGGLLREVPIASLEAESQIQLIKSEAVALAVIEKLNLLEDPEFVPPPHAPSWYEQLRSAVSPSGQRTTQNPTQAALAAIANRLKVNYLGGNVIEIEFRSPTPARAAEIANAFADCFIADQLKFRHQSARQAGTWLQERIQELGKKSALADDAVVQFKAKNNIIAAGGQLITDRQLTELNTQLVAAREKTTEARAKLDRIEAIISENPGTGSPGGAVTETLNNPIIVALRSKYLDLVNREVDWSGRFGADHLAVINLRRQIREIRTSISDELRRIAETYKSEYEIARQRQGELEHTVADAVATSQDSSQAQIELRRLESSAEAYRELYRSALQRNTELGQQETFPDSDARLVTRASAPLQKSGIKNSIILLVSAMCGAMFGLGLGMARMALDRVFRTPTQIEAVLLADCLALVPLLRAAKPQDDSALADGPRTIHRTRSIVWDVVDRPLARFAEAMRSVKSAADVGARPAKVLGFTSSLPSEGKSTIGASFALLAAQSGAKTILIDCDLRHPALTEMLTPDVEYGLMDVLVGKKTLEEVVWTEPSTNLVFLPGAMKARMANSSDVLASSGLRKLLADLRKTYDYVVMDFPPTAPIVDVRSTAGLVDAYVFVVEWARTKIPVAELALKKTPMVRANLLGVVLNKVDFKKLDRYDSHRSDYYSDKYYVQYGDRA